VHITLSWSALRFVSLTANIRKRLHNSRDKVLVEKSNALRRVIATYMKRYGNLKKQILSETNLIQSEHNARKGKNKTYGVKRFDKRDELTLEKIA